MKKLLAVIVLTFSVNSVADGNITVVTVSGPDDPNHPNVVQIEIQGGYNTAECNTSFAAIKNTPDRQHLVSFALAAYVSKEPVRVVLAPEKYFADRCTIARISSAY